MPKTALAGREKSGLEASALPEQVREPLVGIVIVNYNSYEHSARCIESVRALNYRNYFIVVVDNNSNDGSGFKLQRKLEDGKTFVILSPDNRGFAAGCNFGIRFAQIREADFVWLLNAEIRVHPDSLRALVSQAERFPDTAAFGSKVLAANTVRPHSDSRDSSKGQTLWSAYGKVDFSRQEIDAAGRHEIDNGQYDAPCESDCIPDSSLLLRAAVLDDIGYLPEEFFLYFEQTDWCLRMKRRGYALRYSPQSVVWRSEEDDGSRDPQSAYYRERNKRIFWFRHGTRMQGAGLVFRTLFIDLPRSFRAKANAPDVLAREIARAEARGCIDFLLGRSGKRV